MVTIAHTPTISKKSKCIIFDQCYTITGDCIEDIINFCKPRVRVKSWGFYEKEIRSDLQKYGDSIIDHHAGMGTLYLIVLKTI